MLNQQLSQLETEFFKTLNQFAEPLIRVGFANPLLWPTGAIVLEVTGRKTGQTIRVPLIATRIGDLFLVSTYRRRSEWVKNLTANPEARYWLGGRPHDATAFVVTPGNQLSSPDSLPPRAACLAGLLKQQSQLFGLSFALIVPRD